ncbi:cell division protein [Limosilactobacillus reuteri]|uniref:Cell division protein n=1 Tax=Limosilactobacillus reuteri TaxID=1598 RepID=A0A855X8Y1_LIMRT|nr:type II toxin-antitoxin system PemK/MazF family toxin [Limosilactobacillus reuteri]PWT39087.1 cell division protein [Limosilactobacillus reuteri]PWT68048.1 cell division protein [Limosilactobacillus reuteri]
MSFNKGYLPDRQDIIWINFQPSRGQEIRGRHPALVISSKEYSLLTGLVMVMPITHANNNRLKEFFIPLHGENIEGFINPLQTFTFSIMKRNAEYSGETANTVDWAQAITIHNQIIGNDD